MLRVSGTRVSLSEVNPVFGPGDSRALQNCPPWTPTTGGHPAPLRSPLRSLLEMTAFDGGTALPGKPSCRRADNKPAEGAMKSLPGPRQERSHGEVKHQLQRQAGSCVSSSHEGGRPLRGATGTRERQHPKATCAGTVGQGGDAVAGEGRAWT